MSRPAPPLNGAGRPAADSERRRLLAGAARALSEHGPAALTVPHVTAAAGLPAASFQAHFADLRECLLAAHRAAFERLMAEIVRACQTQSLWPRKLRAALAAVFALAAAEPQRVRLLAASSSLADPALAEQAREHNAHLAALLREGRRHTPNGGGLPEVAELGLIIAVAGVLGERLRGAPGEDLGPLEAEVAQLLLTFYVGPAEAAWLAVRWEGP